MASQDTVSLTSWGFVIESVDSGPQELNLIKSLDVEIVESIMFALLYVISNLFLEDMRKENNFMVISRAFSKLSYFLAAIFFLVVLAECVLVQNVLNLIILCKSIV